MLQSQLAKMRYFKGDYASVKKVDWDTLLRTGSIDNVWDRFVDKLSIACKDNVQCTSLNQSITIPPGWTKRP